MPDLTHFTGTIIKSIDLPDEVAKAAKGQDVDHWFYASVEVEDLDGDVVRVKGLRATGDIPFIVGHKLGPNTDGSLPVIGKTVGWHVATHKSLGVPAMVVGTKYAPTRLGKEFKALYDDGFLTDVSIQFIKPKGGRLPSGKREITECEIIELSACIKGVNEYASIVKAMELDNDDSRIESAFSRLEKSIEQFDQNVTKRIRQINSTFDDLESAIVAAPNASEQDGNSTSDADNESEWSSFAKALDALKASLPTSK